MEVAHNDDVLGTMFLRAGKLANAFYLIWETNPSQGLRDISRADDALRQQFNARFDGSREYATARRNAYANYEAAIATAVEELPKARVIMRTEPPLDHEILATDRETWFKERVFDTFLWEIAKVLAFPGASDDSLSTWRGSHQRIPACWQ